jgi:hypothetical protein
MAAKGKTVHGFLALKTSKNLLFEGLAGVARAIEQIRLRPARKKSRLARGAGF